MAKWNIVQAEFFLRGGAPIKVTVRFYDAGGVVARFMLQEQKFARRTSWLFKKTFGTHGWRQRFWGSLFWVYSRSVSSAMQRRKEVTSAQLLAALRASAEVALERPNRSFLPLAKEEAHELVERVDRATGVWLFMFHPNDLLDDKQASLTHLM